MGGMPIADPRLILARPPCRFALPRWVIAVVALGVSFASIPQAALRAGADGVTGDRLRWGADSEGGAPYIFKNPDDLSRNMGFEVDLVEALSREMGAQIDFHQYGFENLLLGLQRGDLDIALNGLEVTPERMENFRLTRPYYVYRLQLVTRADDDRIATLQDCKAIAAKVGTLGETAASRLLEQMGIEAKVYDGQMEPYRDLEVGNVDAVLLDLPIAQYCAKPNSKLKFVGAPVGKGLYAAAVRKDRGELAERVDTALQRLLDSGELRRIYEKWELWNDDQRELGSAELARGSDFLTESRQKYTFDRYFPLLCHGAWVTLLISVESMALAMLLGLFVSLARMYGPAPLRWLAVGYVELFRGIPVLLLLYVLYYGLPTLSETLHLGFSLHFADWTVAVLTFGLNYGAYEAEIYRGGISSIPLGQWEAAASLGMSPAKTFYRIILPQALRVIMPPVTNDFVALFKDTSLVSGIAVVELTKQYQLLSKSSQKYFEIGLVTAVIYLCMSVPLSWLARRLEKKWGKG